MYDSISKLKLSEIKLTRHNRLLCNTKKKNLFEHNEKLFEI